MIMNCGTVIRNMALKVDCTSLMVKTQTAELFVVPPFLPRKLAE